MSETNGTREFEIHSPIGVIHTRTTNPAMLRLLQEEIENPDPVPIVEEEVEPRKRPPVLQKRFDVAIRDWTIRQISTPKRIVRWVAWWFKLPWRIGSLLWAVTGKRLDVYAVEKRNEACADCPMRYDFIRRNGKVSAHCAGCNCPAWRLSDLDFKNRLERWHCPQRKHEGPYPDDGIRNLLESLGYDPNGSAGGCSGCGCGKKQGGA